VIEDIVDTGASLKYICKLLDERKPRTLKTCVLVYKETLRSTLPKEAIDYLGIVIPDVFIVGYGIDCAQQYRWLPYIGKVNDRRQVIPASSRGDRFWG